MKWNEIFAQLTMLAQLGLSLATPILICLAACYLLCTRLGFGLWVYIPGMIMGLGASFMTAYKVYLAVTGRQKKRERGEKEVSFNKHI